MTPLAQFESVWARCDQLAAMQGYLASNVTAALDPAEMLRAEWMARVSALDMYVHELVAQRMLAIFDGLLPATPAFQRFHLSAETVFRIRTATTPSDASAAFDLEIRERLRLQTFQDPEKIADAVRLCSAIELWNKVAVQLGAQPNGHVEMAKSVKRELSLIVRRRNQIAHEGDLQPILPKNPWPIAQADLVVVRTLIERIVRAIDAVV